MKSKAFNLRIITGFLVGIALCGGAALSGADALATTAQDSSTSITQSNTSAKSIVKNGVFTISAKDYAGRMNTAYKVVDALMNGNEEYTGYKATLVKSVNGTTLDMDIRKDSSFQAYAEFQSPDSDWIDYTERNKSKTFDTILFIFPSSTSSAGCFASTIMAAVMASDPTISTTQAGNIANALMDEFDTTGEIGTVTKNSITYALMRSDNGTWAFGVTC